MKIVCDSCGAKYSIADEKVQGKVFKIRCKKCSNVIVVKGTDDAASDGYGGNAAEWYVVIDGDQVGPIPSVEIDSYYMAGKINADTYVWRDGLSDWVAISTVSDFAHLTQSDVAGPDDATQIAESPSFADDIDETAVAGFGAGVGAGAASSSDMFGGASADDATVATGVDEDFGASDYGAAQDDLASAQSDYGAGQDDYGYAAAESSEDFGSEDYGSAAYGDEGYGSDDYNADEGYSGFSAAAAGGGGFGGGVESAESDGGDEGGMFAAFDSGSDEDDGGDFMSFGGGSSGGASANGSNGSGGGFVSQNDMVGQRNENSVLFSLSSLDQVSAVSEPSGGGGGGGAPAAGGDGPVTEGSGLIDIRALASAHESMKGSGQGADDGLDPFAHGTMSMPALMPMGSHRSNKPLIIGAIIGGILFLGLVGVVIALTLGADDKKEGEQQVIVKEIIREVAPAAVEGKSTEEEDKEAEEAAAAAAAAEEAAEVGAESDSEKEEEEPKKAASATKPRKSKPTAAKSEPSPRPKKKDGIDGLLQDLDKKGSSKSSGGSDEPAPSASSGLKKKLGRSDVKNTIERYSGRVHTCYTQHNSKNLSGTMRVKFYIKPSGRVVNPSVVTGTFKGSDVGSCVEKVVRGMRFPATSASSNVPIKYPFVMK